MDELIKKYETAMEELEESYGVEGVITEDTRMVFILESPHTAEVKNNIPVAGSSGATMTRNLFEDNINEPLGLLIKKHLKESKELPRLEKIGLLNVSNIPLQKRPYKKEDLTGTKLELLEQFEKVRKNNQKDSFKESDLEAAQELLLKKFRNRLNNFTDRSLILVPCGRFAQKFFRIANVTADGWRVIEEVPHPSYNSWSRDRYKDQIEEVRRALKSA
ncbi:uracil-DNA glycosylase family protein [Pseudalkalibacillus caeni]|uniref:Uracil-DNA glycosylase-like domain-containing protein n=1 Tax=Exobacillus caeni TaxID=2574798 RepID=A0A5R9F1E1_9BACL|nr:uracil-DNA glycosylase family protein [Pseudalkalibacillus caeni]TLS37452.1 hypothetical protein FCL54_09910 [Pseudalkalibacillus caeni]